LPEKSVPVADSAALVALRPAFSAFCWRARACPPFFAAARRLVCPPELELEERLEPEERLELDRELRLPDPLRLEELWLDDPDALLPPREDELRLDELPDPERLPPERAPDPDERRPPDDPPLEPLEDSAIASPPR
jgi:hypothetical protein